MSLWSVNLPPVFLHWPNKQSGHGLCAIKNGGDSCLKLTDKTKYVCRCLQALWSTKDIQTLRGGHGSVPCRPLFFSATWNKAIFKRVNSNCSYCEWVYADVGATIYMHSQWALATVPYKHDGLLDIITFAGNKPFVDCVCNKPNVNTPLFAHVALLSTNPYTCRNIRKTGRENVIKVQPF